MDHISFTQMNMLLKCGIQYQFRYVDKKVIPPSASLVRGWVGHRVTEENFKQKIVSQIDMSEEQVVDLYATGWESEKHSIALTDKEIGDSTPKAVIGKFKDSGIGMIKVFHREQSPMIEPESVEDEYRIEFEGGYPAVLGRWDVIDTNHEINEIKFVGKSPAKDDLDYDVQVTGEDFGFRQTFKCKPTRLIKRYAIATKEPKTDIQVAAPRDDDTIRRFLFRVEKSMEIIKLGTFQPAPIGCWWCHPNWCGYWGFCKYHP